MSRIIQVKEKFVWLENAQSSSCEEVKLLSGDGESVFIPFTFLVATSNLMQTMLSPCCPNYSGIPRVILPSATGAALKLYSFGETGKLSGEDIDSCLANVEEVLKMLGCDMKLVIKLSNNSSNDHIQIGKVESLATIIEIKSELGHNQEEAVITLSDEDIIERMESEESSNSDLQAHKLQNCDVMVKKVNQHAGKSSISMDTESSFNQDSVQSSVRINVVQSSASKDVKKSRTSKDMKKSSATKDMKKFSASKDLKKSSASKDVKKSSASNDVKKSSASKDVKKSRCIKIKKKASASKSVTKFNDGKPVIKSNANKNVIMSNASKNVIKSYDRNVFKFNATKNVIKSNAVKNVNNSACIKIIQSSANKSLLKSKSNTSGNVKKFSACKNMSSAGKDVNQNAELQGSDNKTDSPIPLQCSSNVMKVKETNISMLMIKDLGRLKKDCFASESNNAAGMDAVMGSEEEGGEKLKDKQTNQFDPPIAKWSKGKYPSSLNTTSTPRHSFTLNKVYQNSGSHLTTLYYCCKEKVSGCKSTINIKLSKGNKLICVKNSLHGHNHAKK